ncbi:MAG TPA: TetR family transcriptional regulator [Terriglobus sp.]
MARKMKVVPTPARKTRADAVRNKEHILAVARDVFTSRGVDVSMNEIAKAAQVGAGTLYRNFPTRDELLAAVYRSEVDKLASTQKKFSAEMPPLEALRAWMLVFVDYIAAKQIITPALNAMVGGAAQIYAETSEVLNDATQTLAKNAVAAGELSADVDPMDMLRAIYGVATAANSSDWPKKARRFVDILIEGAKP